EIETPARKLSASVEEVLESLKRNQSADTDDARHCILRHSVMRRRKTRQVHPVINTVNFRSRIGAALAQQVAAVIGFGRNELRGSANLPQQVIIAEVLHEILSVCRYAEWNPRNLFQEHRGVRRSIREVHMNMIHAAALEMIGKV